MVALDIITVSKSLLRIPTSPGIAKRYVLIGILPTVSRMLLTLARKNDVDNSHETNEICTSAFVNVGPVVERGGDYIWDKVLADSVGLCVPGRLTRQERVYASVAGSLVCSATASQGTLDRRGTPLFFCVDYLSNELISQRLTLTFVSL